MGGRVKQPTLIEHRGHDIKFDTDTTISYRTQELINLIEITQAVG